MKFSLSFTVYSLQLKKMKKIQTTMQFMRFIGLDRLNRHAGLMACAVFFTLHSSLFTLTSCSSELEGPEDHKGIFLRVTGYTNEYVEVDAVTRATVSWQPSGYKEEHIYLAYGIFFTKSDGTVIKNKFHHGADNKWRMIEEVEADDNYYLYGYMPYDAGNVTVAPPDGKTYADGVKMTFTGLNAAMTKDLCIVTSAKDATRNKAPESTEENPKYTYELGNGLDWLPQGDFKCKIKAGEGESNANTLFFLFDHLYAALRLRFRIDETYNQLRDIVIKRLELESYKDEACTNLMPKLKTSITLLANNTGDSPIVGDVVFQEDPSAGKMEKILIYDKPDATWENDNEGKNDRLPSLGNNSQPVYKDDLGYVPKSGGENYYKLTTTYDIYDTNGNLIRKNQTAVNVLNPKVLFAQPQLRRGYMYTLRITIAPTFLYMMSDDDLEFKIDISEE